MTDVQTRRTPFALLHDALHDLHLAEQQVRLGQDAAWQRYVKEVDRILAVDRQRLDDLRVQTGPGTMEGQDLLTQGRAVLDQLGSRSRR